MSQEEQQLQAKDQSLANDIDRELAEFLEKEKIHSSVFTRKGLKRLSCFSHTLQLVVSAFNKHPSAKELLSNAFKVVKQVSRSGKVTEALIAATGKKLVSNCPTRWTSAYLVIKRLLEVEEALKTILLQHRMFMLQAVEWDALKDVRDLLSEFAVYTNVAGSESYTTISEVLISYIQLELHLDEMKQRETVADVADVMLTELKKRLGKLLDTNDKDHDPLYMMAALLDPRFKALLDDHQIQYSKKECLKLLMCNDSSDDDDNCSNTIPQAASSPHRSESATGPPQKRLKSDDSGNKRNYALAFEKIVKSVAEKKEIALRHPKLPEIELNAYIQITDGQYFPLDTDPILYWCKSSLKILPSFAIDLLATPASSAPVERTFSAAGIATSGRRNRLARANLEKEVLIKKNKEYLESFF